MIKLIKGGEVYGPEYLGKKDVLILSNKIGAIKEEIDIDFGNDIEISYRFTQPIIFQLAPIAATIEDCKI